MRTNSIKVILSKNTSFPSPAWNVSGADPLCCPWLILLWFREQVGSQQFMYVYLIFYGKWMAYNDHCFSLPFHETSCFCFIVSVFHVPLWKKFNHIKLFVCYIKWYVEFHETKTLFHSHFRTGRGNPSKHQSEIFCTLLYSELSKLQRTILPFLWPPLLYNLWSDYEFVVDKYFQYLCSWTGRAFYNFIYFNFDVFFPILPSIAIIKNKIWCFWQLHLETLKQKKGVN